LRKGAIVNEKNVSAQQDQAEKDSRLPGSVPDKERSRRAGSQTGKGAEKIVGLRFARSQRITRRPEFLVCYSQGRRLFTKYFIVFVLPREDGAPARLGVAVGRKIGRAIKRNRIKRLIREFFRRGQRDFPPGLDVVVVAKRGPDFADLAQAQVDDDLGLAMRKVAATSRDQRETRRRDDTRREP